MVTPVLIFLCVTFIFPILDMLFRSVANAEIPTYLPKTVKIIETWDGEDLPGEDIYQAMLEDLILAAKDRTIGKLGTRLNYQASGMRSLMSRTSRGVKRYDPAEHTSAKEFLLSIDKKWSQKNIWNIIKLEKSKYTNFYYVEAADYELDLDTGKVVSKPESESIYIDLFFRTFWMSMVITLLTLLLGYPIAMLLANIPLRYANLLMIMVLLPFWTSLLVRTSTWIAVLQSHGVLNDILVALGFIDDENRIQMIHNSTGTFIAMTHILLPFMILPLYSVMKTINPSFVKAARSLGASSFRAFWKIYFPLTLSGIGAGGVLVFILSIGYYITPALVGGETGRFITNMIAHHMSSSLNWGLAAALASILLFFVIILYFIYNKFANISDIKFG
mgnify:CR=1 FL=1